MNFTGMSACGWVTLDCAQRAMGTIPQELFGFNAVWVWWVVAFFWGLNAVGFALRGMAGVP